MQLRAVSGWNIASLRVGDYVGVMLLQPSKEVGCAIVLGNGTDVIACVLMLWRPCCISGKVCGLPVSFRWSVKLSLRMGVLEEGDGVVLGVS